MIRTYEDGTKRENITHTDEECEEVVPVDNDDNDDEELVVVPIDDDDEKKVDDIYVGEEVPPTWIYMAVNVKKLVLKLCSKIFGLICWFFCWSILKFWSFPLFMVSRIQILL